MKSLWLQNDPIWAILTKNDPFWGQNDVIDRNLGQGAKKFISKTLQKLFQSGLWT